MTPSGVRLPPMRAHEVARRHHRVRADRPIIESLASRQQPDERLLDEVLRELGVLDVHADDAADHRPQIADPGRERVGEITDVGAIVTSGHR